MGWDNINVRLSANVSGFVAQMGAAAGAVKGFGREAVQTAANTDAKTRQVTANVGKLMLGLGAGAALAMGVATAATMGFDKQLSNLSAVTNATTEEMGQLRTAALEAGAATSFTAGQAAQAEAELARAGVAIKDVLSGGLRGAMDLAAAGQLELKESATLTAQALNVFQLRGAQASRVADTLAAGANKSAADVSQLGEALRMGGLVARQVGLSLEDTTGVLSLFSDNALIGSDAGTSLKVMLQRLNPFSKEAAALMKHLGISFFDANGDFIGITETARVLQTQLGGLSQQQRLAAFTTLFGADAIRSANILYEEGAAGVRSYIDAVTDQGAAQRMAEEQLDNLAGDLERLKGSLETVFIENGSKATGVLRGLAQGAEAAVNGFGGLPGVVQSGVGALTLLTGVVGLLGGGFLLLGPKIAQALTLYRQLTTTAPALAAGLRIGAVGLGVLGGALALGTIALAAYGKKKAEAKAASDQFAQALKQEQDGLEGATAAALSKALADKEIITRATEAGVSVKTITAAVRGSESAWRDFQSQLKRSNADDGKLFELATRVQKLSEAYRDGKASAAELASAEKELGVETDRLGGAQGGALDPTADLTEQIEAQKKAAEEDAERIDELAGAIRGFLGASQAVASVQQRESTSASKALSERHKAETTAMSDRTRAAREGATDRARAEREALSDTHRAERDALEDRKRALGEGGARMLEEEERALDQRQEAAERALTRRQEAEERALQKRSEAEERAFADRKEAEAARAEEQGVSLSEFAAELEEQAKAATMWQQNLLVIAQRFGPVVARQMAELGREGAEQTAKLASSAPAEGQRVADALTANAHLATDEAAGVLDAGFELMGGLAAEGGQRIQERFIEELRKGEAPLADLVRRYMALLTPLTDAGSAIRDPAGKVVSVRTSKPGQERAVDSRTGGTTNVLYEANGGFRERHDPQTAPAGAWRVWAEPETGGETYIPHAPTKRRAATKHLAATADLFGYDLVERDGRGEAARSHEERRYASGGFLPRQAPSRPAPGPLSAERSVVVRYAAGGFVPRHSSTAPASPVVLRMANGGAVSAPPATSSAASAVQPAAPPLASAEVLAELRALRAAVAAIPGARVEAHQHNTFQDRPAAQDLEYANRQQAWAIAAVAER